MNQTSKAAQTLGRLGAGKPKNYSPSEIARRTALLAKARAVKQANQRKDTNTQ